MRVFNAMLIDAYRELNSRKLFWITLALSFIVVLFYASIGFGDDGMSIFFGLWNIDSDVITRDSPFARILYRGIFSTFIVPIWLAWIATILALISTATIFPDFVAGGSIDLVLSKPIGRVRLFIYKYLVSLLFVLLQVSLFCIGIFICMGLRLSDWEWRIFLAVPIVTVFFSYLFSVCVLIGVTTRSAIAALLITMLLWFGLWTINQTESTLNLLITDWEVETERLPEQLAERTAQLEQIDQAAEPEQARRIAAQVAMLESRREELLSYTEKVQPWHTAVRMVQIPMPKTEKTIALLDRFLARDDDVNLMDVMQGRVETSASGDPMTTDQSADREVMRRLQEDYESQPMWFVIGSSLAFEFVMLLLACVVFVRRDY